jgi:hypothetical protein
MQGSKTNAAHALRNLVIFSLNHQDAQAREAGAGAL